MLILWVLLLLLLALLLQLGLLLVMLLLLVRLRHTRALLLALHHCPAPLALGPLGLPVPRTALHHRRPRQPGLEPAENFRRLAQLLHPLPAWSQLLRHCPVPHHRQVLLRSHQRVKLEEHPPHDLEGSLIRTVRRSGRQREPKPHVQLLQVPPVPVRQVLIREGNHHLRILALHADIVDMQDIVGTGSHLPP